MIVVVQQQRIEFGNQLDQLFEEGIARKQCMHAAGDQEPWADLRGIGPQLDPVVAEQRIDRHDSRFQQCEEHDVQFGLVTQLHQRPVTLPQAVVGQPLGEMARGRIQLGIAELPAAAYHGNGVRLRPGLLFEHVVQRFAEPVTGFAVAFGEGLGPPTEGRQAHTASRSRPNALSMVPSLVPVSRHSDSGQDAETSPAPANRRTWR